MKLLYERLRSPKPNLSLLNEVHAAHQPSLLSGIYSEQRWRHSSMGLTLDYITNPSMQKALQSHATTNLKIWSKKKTKPPLAVEVLNQDWGDATLESTKKYGKAYVVLNMANSQFPGGASLEGGSAQEENMWLRTTCSLSLLGKGIYLDKDSNTFRYDEETRALVRALKKMTVDEINILSQRRKETIPEAYKVLLQPEPQVCFRGPELLIETDSADIGRVRGRSAESTLSFPFLQSNLIFPFYELRSAAPDLSDNKMDWHNSSLVEKYKIDMRRRIAAQLDTLILAEKSHVILGAWGCGAFRNKPDFIAEVYREEIEKRATFFDHIVFPILNPSYLDNFSVFKEYLSGLKLGRPTPKETPGVQAKKATTESNRSHFFPSLTEIDSKTAEELSEKATTSATLGFNKQD